MNDMDLIAALLCDLPILDAQTDRLPSHGTLILDLHILTKSKRCAHGVNGTHGGKPAAIL